MRCTILVFLLLGALAEIRGNSTHLIGSSGDFRDRLLSRKVRALVFPDKASVLLTAALTKIIVGGRPSGLQYSLEFDIYHPLPDTIEGWQPKILKRLKPKPTPKRRWDWTYYRRPNSSSSSYSKNSDYWGPYKSDEKVYHSQSVYKTPLNDRPSISRNSFYRLQRPKQKVLTSPPFNRDSFYKTPWHLATYSQPRNAYQPEEEVYESWSHVPSWKLNRGYRERRDIFDQFEAMGKVFRIDLRSCIKRAMCELRARLDAGHHEGFLMEDLMRIVLTLPVEILDDKYRHRKDINDCARFYAPSCPYKVLDFLTQSGKRM